MYAITGSTGQLGQLVIESLLTQVPASEIAALARDPAKAKSFADRGVQVRRADYNDAAGFAQALAGVDKLLLISSNDLGKRPVQHRTVIEAAKRAGVKLIAYTSVLHADQSVLGLAKDHRETESDLKASGLAYVLLRNGWYSENYTASVASALAHGGVFGSAGNGRISSAPRAQYAKAAALVLTEPNQAGRTYELAGDSSYSLGEFATELSAQSGKSIPYQNLPQADYEALLVKVGLPPPVANLLADSDAAAAKGALFDESRQLIRLIGVPTISIKVSIQEALRPSI